jgi:hypothetical protein
MTTDQHISKLEKDIEDVKDQLDKLITLVQEMNKGLYGDVKNDHIGVIEKQKLLSDELSDIKKEILDIHKKNLEQDIALQTKKTFKGDILVKIKEFVHWGITVFMLYYIWKNQTGLDPDAVMKY